MLTNFEFAMDRIWLVTFMQYALGYFDDETCRLEPIDNPFGPKIVTYASGMMCHPCVGNRPKSAEPSERADLAANSADTFKSLAPPRG